MVRLVQQYRDRPRSMDRRSAKTSECYSCAYELDISKIDEMEEQELTRLRVPELPEYVREAFRFVAKGDVAGLEELVRQKENVLLCINQGGQSLAEVASERGRHNCVEALKKLEEELFHPPDRPQPSALAAWMKDHDLDELVDPILELAADVSDLLEMTDSDVVALFQNLPHALRFRNERRLREALVSLGALVSRNVSTTLTEEDLFHMSPRLSEERSEDMDPASPVELFTPALPQALPLPLPPKMSGLARGASPTERSHRSTTPSPEVFLGAETEAFSDDAKSSKPAAMSPTSIIDIVLQRAPGRLWARLFPP